MKQSAGSQQHAAGSPAKAAFSLREPSVQQKIAASDDGGRTLLLEAAEGGTVDEVKALLAADAPGRG